MNQIQCKITKLWGGIEMQKFLKHKIIRGIRKKFRTHKRMGGNFQK